MPSVAVLDVGTTSVAVHVVDLDGAVRGRSERPLPRPATDPPGVEQVGRLLLAEVAGAVPSHDWLGVVVVAPRQALVATTTDGTPLGRPGLRAVLAHEPDLARRAEQLAGLHDWLVARMTGVRASALPYACATGLVDVPARQWSAALLAASGLRREQLAPAVEAGAVVGELGAGWGLPPTLPVVAGTVRAQLVAAAAGGLEDGVLTIAAGRGGFVQLATASPPQALPAGWSAATHAVPGLWALERAGEQAGERSAVLAQAERALGRPVPAVVEVDRAAVPPAAVAAVAAVLVARAVGAHAHLPHRPRPGRDTSGS